MKIVYQSVCAVRKTALQNARKNPEGLRFVGTVKEGYRLGYYHEATDRLTMFGPHFRRLFNVTEYTERVFKVSPRRLSLKSAAKKAA
jgi:hypothetical protein